MAEGTITEKEFSRLNEICKDLIKEASLCLRDEPVGTMEKVFNHNSFLMKYQYFTSNKV